MFDRYLFSLDGLPRHCALADPCTGRQQGLSAVWLYLFWRESIWHCQLFMYEQRPAYLVVEVVWIGLATDLSSSGGVSVMNHLDQSRDQHVVNGVDPIFGRYQMVAMEITSGLETVHPVTR